MNRENKKFVIQKHTIGPDAHWDFMLEQGESLQTYRLDKSPEQILHTPANAVKIFDHPLKFLAYEGSVNKGRARVNIVEAGTYQIINQQNNHIELELAGQTLKGKFTLATIENNNCQFGKNNPTP